MQLNSDGGRRAFSIVEMLVVITIISMLMALLLPSMERSRELSRRTVCSMNQKQIYLASATYATDFGSYLPNPPRYTVAQADWVNGGGSLNTVWNNWGGTANNPTGFWQLFHGPVNAKFIGNTTTGKLSADYNYVSDFRIGHCPNMDAYNFSYRKPGSLNNGYWIDYDYRFNNMDSAKYGFYADGQYRADALTRAPNYLALFQEATNYRLQAGLIPFTVSVGGYRWSHLEGGNITRFDGAVKFVANQINTSAAGFYGNGISWPTAWPSPFYYYSGGGYSNVGMDAMMLKLR